MTASIDFPKARDLVVTALVDHYREKFPERQLVAQEQGRDLIDSWAVFVGLLNDDGSFEPLIGAPVAIVDKANGEMGFVQIPPHFEILDAPLIADVPDASAPPHGSADPGRA